MKEISDYKQFEHLIPEVEDWPITQFSQKRKAFLHSLNEDLLEYFKQFSIEEIDQILARTIYLEKQRIKSNPWKADPPNELQYYRKIQDEYNENQQLSDKYKGHLETLSRLINRFAIEITGNFKKSTFLFTRKVTDVFFHLLFFPFSLRSLYGRKRMHEKNKEAIRINGYCSEVRALFNDHVIILVPTHSSNLDSILIGYTMDTVAGLPAFSYGAGLNLFDSEFFAYFMNRLGAYKVDRRKKNSIYLNALTAYSKLSVLEGVNTIFFPGGTRSRSGEVESKVKLGLLGSLIQAQRMLIEKGKSKKVIIVPVVLGYESVLEAGTLIVQHLLSSGQEKFTSRPKRKGIAAYWRVTKRLIKKGSAVYLTFGKPMDVFGNYIDHAGNSFNHKGVKVQLTDYFTSNGKIIKDDQREMIYTRELGDRISDAYKTYNYILPAHLVAYAAFQILCRQNPQHDIYSIVQLQEEEYSFSKNAVESLCRQLRELLCLKAENNEIIYPKELEGNISDIVNIGIQRLGVFHINKVLKWDDYGRIMSEDFSTLLFYSNKLSNLELASQIDWASINLEAERI